MAEETVTGTEGTEQAQVEAGATEDQVATETTETTAEVQEDAAQALWAEVVPELAEAYQELSPEAREQVLLRRLAAKPAAALPTEDAPARESSNGEPKPQEPSTYTVPEPWNVDEALSQIAYSLENDPPEKQAQVIVNVMKKNIDYVHGYGRLLLGVREESDRKLTGFEKQLLGVTRPGQLGALVAKVRGATAADVTAATALLESGVTSDMTVAMKLAVYNRESEMTTAKTEPSAAAQRKAAALRAARASGANRAAGGRQFKPPVSEADYKELLEAQARGEIE